MTDAPERIWAEQYGGSGPWYTEPDMCAKPGVEYIRADLAKPRVKPLVWRQYCSNTGNCSAPAFGDEYMIERCGEEGFGLWLPRQAYYDEPKSYRPTLEAAKAAAQADYERRILEALE